MECLMSFPLIRSTLFIGGCISSFSSVFRSVHGVLMVIAIDTVDVLSSQTVFMSVHGVLRSFCSIPSTLCAAH